MASYTKLTLSQLRSLVRLKLADASGRWWSDAQLNQYIAAWQHELNESLEILWYTATTTISARLTALSTIATGIHSIKAVRRYSDGVELPMLEPTRLNELHQDFRLITGPVPGAWYMEEDKLGLFPSPSADVSINIEYIKIPDLTDDSDAMEVPAWAKYSVIPYVCHRAYKALGPNFDYNKAMKYKSRFEWWMQRFRGIANKWFALRPLSLKVDTGLAARYRTVKEQLLSSGTILSPGGFYAGAHAQETPSGTVDGVNTVFTLTTSPVALLLMVNGVAQEATTNYTLSDDTITFVAGSIPQPGDSIVAYYWV